MKRPTKLDKEVWSVTMLGNFVFSDGIQNIRFRPRAKSCRKCGYLPGMAEDQEQRLIELETRSAYQEHTLGQLNEVILELRASLESLQREVSDLRARAEKGDLDIGPANDKPPHW